MKLVELKFTDDALNSEENIRWLKDCEERLNIIAKTMLHSLAVYGTAFIDSEGNVGSPIKTY